MKARGKAKKFYWHRKKNAVFDTYVQMKPHVSGVRGFTWGIDGGSNASREEAEVSLAGDFRHIVQEADEAHSEEGHEHQHPRDLEFTP